MLGPIATLVTMLVLLSFPVLIPAAVSAFHTLAQLRRRWAEGRAARNRLGYVIQPIPASD